LNYAFDWNIYQARQFKKRAYAPPGIDAPLKEGQRLNCFRRLRSRMRQSERRAIPQLRGVR